MGCHALKLVAAVGLACVLGAAPVAADEDHRPPTGPASTGRVGVLLADHGEPPEYNEWTYESFRDFFHHLMHMGVVPEWLRLIDTGTMLYDAGCPGCPEPRPNPRLVDAWLTPHHGPAVFVPASDDIAAHYVLPAGPGFGEADIFELVGLGAWDEWRRMGGRSPNYDEKLAKKNAVVEHLGDVYGDEVVFRAGYGIDPRIGGGRQGIRETVEALVRGDRVSALVVAYHGVGFSDLMQTHHLRHQVHETLEELGADIPVVFTKPMGTTQTYVDATVEKVRAELELIPPDEPVAIHLSGHGLPTDMCGDYDCGGDAYHQYSADLFARTRDALLQTVHRPGPWDLVHVYGDGGEDEDDPGNEVDSPVEALDRRVGAGFRHVIDIPYEFDSNSRDTLIVLRHGYRREPPDWNATLESHFEYGPLEVKLANANGAESLKIEAYEQLIQAGLAALGAARAADGQSRPTPAANGLVRAT